jgi:uncharacterized membrane protein
MTPGGRRCPPAGGAAPSGDEGQLTILLLGLLLLVLMVLTLGWDVGNWLIGRRALNDAADGAAVAAASDLDRQRFYATGGADVLLAGATARATVTEIARLSGIDGMRASAEVDLDPDRRARVTVRATAPAATAFLHLVGLVAPEMDAEAAASVERASPG